MCCDGKGIGRGGLTHSLEKADPLLVYWTFKARIRAAAQEKYRKHLIEEDGLVMVRRKDLGAA